MKKYVKKFYLILLIPFLIIFYQNCQPFELIDDIENASQSEDANTQNNDNKKPPIVDDGDDPVVIDDGVDDNDFVEAKSTIGCSNWRADHPNWLFCEDFESGNGNFDTWYKQSGFVDGHGLTDRGRLTLSSGEKNHGKYSVHMPAAASSKYQGGELYWRDCEGEQKKGCKPKVGHEKLYYRAYIKFASDHKKTHHFMSVGGFRANTASGGTAGCLPNGINKMGTTVDHSSHSPLFYTYSPGMKCERVSLNGSNGSKAYNNYWMYASQNSRWCVANNSKDAFLNDLNRDNCHCSHCSKLGFPTCTSNEVRFCWGNHYKTSAAKKFPVGKWFCFEMMMKANSVSGNMGNSDGEMAYWVDGEMGHRSTTMMFRKASDLKLNKVNLSHYITSEGAGGHSNRVWFDDVAVSTKRIGCN